MCAFDTIRSIDLCYFQHRPEQSQSPRLLKHSIIMRSIGVRPISFPFPKGSTLVSVVMPEGAY